MSFEITRRDGRSDGQVVLDYVRDADPGRLFSYDEIAAALNVNTERVYVRADVCRAVRQAAPRLLREQQRRMSNVRTMGYRLSPAAEHLALATRDRRRADVQLKRGVDTLRHVRWEEMDANQRAAHEGTLMLTEAIYLNQVSLDRRVRRIEEMVRRTVVDPAVK